MIKLKRAQIRLGRSGVDVTVKSAEDYARVFSPTWGMVMNYKNGVIDEAMYTKAYHAILDKVTRSAWDWLYRQAVNGEVTLLCYCPDGQFCHTLLLIDYAVKKYPKAFT